MAKARIFNKISKKGYAAYVGQLSQIILPVNWVKENINFNGKEFVDYEY